MRSIRASSLAIACAISLVAPVVRAQPESDAATAEALFEQGKSLMREKRYAEACPKLAESERLDPGTGALLALALCHELGGRTASAWSEFRGVLPMAEREGRADRAKLAREHIAKLEPLLSKLTVRFDPNAGEPKGIEVKRDGVVLGDGAIDTPVPVDPGDHLIEASAPGKKTWRVSVSIHDGGEAKTILVPRLESGKGVIGLALPSDEPVTSGEARATAAYIVGGAGVVALGIGTYFGIRAISKSHDAKALCDPAACTDPAAGPLNSSAKSAATIADVGIGVGIVGIGIATYLLVTGQVESPLPVTKSALRLTPFVSRQGAGAALGGAW